MLITAPHFTVIHGQRNLCFGLTGNHHMEYLGDHTGQDLQRLSWWEFLLRGILHEAGDRDDLFDRGSQLTPLCFHIGGWNYVGAFQKSLDAGCGRIIVLKRLDVLMMALDWAEIRTAMRPPLVWKDERPFLPLVQSDDK